MMCVYDLKFGNKSVELYISEIMQYSSGDDGDENSVD